MQWYFTSMLYFKLSYLDYLLGEKEMTMMSSYFNVRGVASP